MAQEMTASMKLTLVDMASPGVKSLTDALKTLNQAAGGNLPKNLDKTASGIEKIGNSAKTATTALNSLEGMISALDGVIGGFAVKLDQVVTALSGINTRGQQAARTMASIERESLSAERGVARLETALTNAERIAQTANAILNQVSVSLGKIAANSTTAASGLSTVNGNMRQVGGAAQSANTHVGTLNDSLKGLAKLWGAIKIEQGLKDSIKAASGYQDTQTRLKNINLGPANNQTLINAANGAAAAVPQFDRNQMLTLALDLHTATGSVEHAAQAINEFAKLQYNMERATPPGQHFNENDMLLIAKYMERRGATQDPAQLKNELDMVAKIYAATQGRVDAKQLLGNVQYAKYNLGQTMSLDFMPIFASLIEQVKSGGGSGGQVGTSLTSLLQAVVGGVIKKEALPQWAQMGLINKDKVEMNDNGTIKRLEAGAVKGADLFLKNPYLWIQEYLKPAMQKAGIDVSNEQQVVSNLAHMLGNRNAGDIVGKMLTPKGSQQLEKDAGIVRNANGNDAQYAENIKTASAAVDTLKGNMRDLGIIIGGTLLPIITPFVKAFADFVKLIHDFAQEHEIVTTIVSIGTAITGVFLAISGFKSVFGIVGNLTGALTGMSGAATTAAGAMQSTVGPAQLMSQTLGYGSGGAAGAARAAGGTFTRMGGLFRAAGGVIVATCGVIARGMLRLIPIVGQIAMVYSLADVVAHLKAGGVEIITWVIGWGDTFLTVMSNAWARIEGAAKNAWSRIKSVFTGGAVDSNDAAVKATLDRNNRELEQRLRANGMTRTGLMTLGAAPQAKAPAHNVNPHGEPMPTYPAAPGVGPEYGFNPMKQPKAKKGRHPRQRFANYNPEADAAQNDYLLERDQAQRDLKNLERKYSEGDMSIEDYYKQRAQKISEGLDLEIKALKEKKAALEKEKQPNKAAINRTQTEITIKERDKTDQLSENGRLKQKAINDLKATGIKLDEQVAKSEGERTRARIAALNAELDLERKKFAANGQTGKVADVDRLKSQGTAKIELEAMQKQVDQIEHDQELGATRLANAVKAGTRTQIAAEVEIAQKRKEAAKQIDGLIAKMEELAKKSGDPRLVQGVENLKTKTQGTLTELGPVAQKLSGIYENAFSGMFESMTKHGASLKNVFHDTLRSIGDNITKLVSQAMSQQFVKWLMGIGGDGSGGVGPAGGGGSGAGIGALIGKAISAAVGGSFAVGTNYVPHDMLAVIHKGEKITPAAQAAIERKYGAQGGRPMMVTNHFTVQSGTPQQTQAQVAAAAALSIQRAHQRNN